MEIKEAFRQRRQRQMFAAALILPFVLLIALASESERPVFGLNPSFAAGVGLVGMLGGVAFSLWNWRCPGCARYFGRVVNPRHCPNCGTDLQ